MALNRSRDLAWRALGVALLGSAYVPLHRLLVAANFGLTAALLLRLLDDRPTTARVTAAAVGLSPFVWGIGAG